MGAARSDSAVVIEVALNGVTPKSRNPAVPRLPEEIAADGVRCLEAGATILHNHNDESLFGGDGSHAAQPYVSAWRAILEAQPGALCYPTMASGGPHTSIETRYAHIVALAEAGVARLGLVDPGSVNFGPADEEGLPVPVDVVYVNTFKDACYMFDVCERYALGPSISVFEPGFLRVALAYERAGRMPRGAMLKLYFGAGEGPTFGLPATRASLHAYLAMLEGSSLPWCVGALGGDVVESGLARAALELGGHVRVGLEDYAGNRSPANVELVEEAASLAREVGRPIATCEDAIGILDLPG